MALFTDRVTKPYEFVEYPKWLHFEGHPSILVHSLEEENEVLGTEVEEVEIKEEETSEDSTDKVIASRDELAAYAESLGITVKGNWGIARIEKAVEDFEAAQKQFR